MFVVNTSSDYFILPWGYRLPPDGETVEIPDDIYLGNLGLRQQLQSLEEEGKVTLEMAPTAPEDLPEPTELPQNYEATENDFSIYLNGATATTSVDVDEDDNYYGSLNLGANDDLSLHLQAAAFHEDDAMIRANIDASQDGKLVDLTVDESPVLQIESDGKIGFNGVDPVATPTLNPATATTTQIVNALIALGLVEAP